MAPWTEQSIGTPCKSGGTTPLTPTPQRSRGRLSATPDSGLRAIYERHVSQASTGRRSVASGTEQDGSPYSPPLSRGTPQALSFMSPKETATILHQANVELQIREDGLRRQQEEMEAERRAMSQQLRGCLVLLESSGDQAEAERGQGALAEPAGQGLTDAVQLLHQRLEQMETAFQDLRRDVSEHGKPGDPDAEARREEPPSRQWALGALQWALGARARAPWLLGFAVAFLAGAVFNGLASMAVTSAVPSAPELQDPRDAAWCHSAQEEHPRPAKDLGRAPRTWRRPPPLHPEQRPGPAAPAPAPQDASRRVPWRELLVASLAAGIVFKLQDLL